MEVILAQLLPVIISVLGGLASIAVVRFNKWLKAQTASQAIGVVGELTGSVVNELNAVTVSRLKEAASDGKLTKEEIQDVRNSALTKVINRIPADVAKIAAGGVGDLKAYILGKVEEKVREAKK